MASFKKRLSFKDKMFDIIYITIVVTILIYIFRMPSLFKNEILWILSQILFIPYTLIEVYSVLVLLAVISFIYSITTSKEFCKLYKPFENPNTSSFLCFIKSLINFINKTIIFIYILLFLSVIYSGINLKSDFYIHVVMFFIAMFPFSYTLINVNLSSRIIKKSAEEYNLLLEKSRIEPIFKQIFEENISLTRDYRLKDNFFESYEQLDKFINNYRELTQFKSYITKQATRQKRALNINPDLLITLISSLIPLILHVLSNIYNIKIPSL